MNTIVVVPDSFKGTLSSAQVCDIMVRALSRHLDAKVVALPVADGGEGTVDAFIAAAGGQKVFVPVTGPLGESVEGFYGLLDDGTAIVEMAAAAGLPLVKKKLCPDQTTTYGVGELIVAAARTGAKTIIVGLGGSATTDMGTGAAAAAGVRFFDEAGHEFVPLSGTLDKIARVDISGLDPRVRDADIRVMCDVDNPLYGAQGAAYVFGPQKGADLGMIELLDRGLQHASTVVERGVGVHIADLEGAGAAGGMGAGMVAFFGATLHRGIDVVLDTVGFDKLLYDADLVITGEGCLDSQSLEGKVVVGVARRACTRSVPVIAVVGDIRDGFEPIYDEGVTAVFSTNTRAVPFAEAKLSAAHDLNLTMDNIARILSLSHPWRAKVSRENSSKRVGGIGERKNKYDQ